MSETNAQRNYKDTIFRMLFREKKNLLALYNALNHTAYTNVEDLEITTLENAIYMNYKNDISFVFDFELMLYEHQSTVNPNMPLRDLIYVTRVIQSRTKDEDLYGKSRIKIPAPKFVVFYNGMVFQPEQQVLRLSDAYEEQQDAPEFLSKNRAEAIAVCIFEYDEEKHMKNERNISRIEGEDRAFRLAQYLTDAGKIKDLNLAMSDQKYREQLFREYSL